MVPFDQQTIMAPKTSSGEVGTGSPQKTRQTR